MKSFVIIAGIAILLFSCLYFTVSARTIENLFFSMVSRPQNPTQRSYVIEQVSFKGGADNVRLSGELTTPHGAGPFPAIVLISGSELVDRNSEITKHKLFLVLSHFLTNRGYAVLRYDVRGIGESTGDSHSAIDEDFAADAAAALKWLREDSSVNLSKSGYLGHSQGSIKASLATKITNADFMVFFAGGIETMEDTMRRQTHDIAKVSGESNQLIKAKDDDLKHVFALLTKSKDLDHCGQLLTEYGAELGVSAKPAIKSFCTPWMLNEVHRDPIALTKDYSGPVLALLGTKDLLVSAKTNAPIFKKTLSHPSSKTHIFKGLNHLFQKTEKGGPDEYWSIEMTFDEDVADYIDHWIKNLLN